MATGSATSTMLNQETEPQSYLTASISSLSSARAQTSSVARTYKHATQLYLTRRLSEALNVIEPLVSAPEEHHSPNGHHDDEGGVAAAPVAASSRNTRIKVWSFYLTLLNAIIDLGPEQGKLAFGSSKWKALAAKARDGTIWEDVVHLGYNDKEGEVDGEVVINLATLLLTHMSSQDLHQQRLETYLSSAPSPSYDASAPLEASHSGHRTSDHNNGTSTPRDLDTRLKILELYTLHVLPQHDEWDYARDFISMSEVLDEERREMFLQALDSLKEERNHAAVHDVELKERQRQGVESQRREDERLKSEHIPNEEQSKLAAQAQQNTAPARAPASTNEVASPPPAQSNGRRPAAGIPSTKPQKASKAAVTPAPGLYKRSTALLLLVQKVIQNAGQSVMRNPLSMLRFVLFLLAFTIGFARRDVRERLKRVSMVSWDRIRKTAGMGVKVSYI